MHPVIAAFKGQLPPSPTQGRERPPCCDDEDGRVTTKRTSSAPTKKAGNRKVFVANPTRRGFVVTSTELDAVEDVARFRALRTDQLLRLHWPKPSQRRHGESRLRELFHQGWLDPTPFYGAPGPPRAIYTLGALGRRHCRTTTSVNVDVSAGRERMRDVVYLRHWLFTTDCVIALRLGAEATGGGLVQLFDERRLRRMMAGPGSEMTVVPDAFAVLRVDDAVRSFCIEADRGTVDVRAWRAKVARYLDWTAAPSFKTTFVSPTVLTIVDVTVCNGDRRVDELATATEGVVADRREDPTMFLFANSMALGASADEPVSSVSEGAAMPDGMPQLPPILLGRSEGGPLFLGLGELGSHKHIMGITGMGKSRLVQSFFLQLMERRIGVSLIDPHRDLARDIQSTLIATGYFEMEAAYSRLVYLDFSQKDPIPFNILRAPGSSHDVAYAFVEAVKRAWPGIADGSAPLLENILLAGTLALVEAGQPITRLGALLADDDARAWILARVKDPATVEFFNQRFARWGPRAAQMAESTLRRLFLLTFAPELRGPLGHVENVVNVGRFMDAGVSVIFDLGGVRNPEVRRLLGCLVTVAYELAALNRAPAPARSRRPHHLLIDEFADFVAQSGEALERMLATSRKYGLAVCLVNQTWGQASRRLQGAMQNCQVRIFYRLGQDDAESMAAEVAPGAPGAERLFWASRLRQLPRRHALVLRPAWRPVEMEALDVPDYPVPTGDLANVDGEYMRRAKPRRRRRTSTPFGTERPEAPGAINRA